MCISVFRNLYFINFSDTWCLWNSITHAAGAACQEPLINIRILDECLREINKGMRASWSSRIDFFDLKNNQLSMGHNIYRLE